MTLGTLALIIGGIAIILTLLIKPANWVISFLQNFTGALFIFSGWVKAIDPLGTAYKMEQYFAEFQSTFEGTWFSFMAPLFPWLSNYASSFSVIMIVLEIVLGVMLITGTWRKFTSWAFFLVLAFFTFLTGFTYLTGYVPGDANFFEFSKWGAYEATNMKVTDCGCFGDFLKLEPKISFFKDLVLLVPAIIFLIWNGKMHQLFNTATRGLLVLLTVVGLSFYSFSNYVWDIPHLDFRPFKKGVNIRAQKNLEEEAQLSTEIIAYKLRNLEDGKVVELPFAQYMKEYANYPNESWEHIQIKSEPSVPLSKISDFEIADIDGNDITEDILSDPDYALMIIAHKLYADISTGTAIITDTIYRVDTIQTQDSIILQQSIERVDKRQVQKDVYSWKEATLKPWIEKVNPILEQAEAAALQVYAITAYADPAMIDDFRHATQSAYPFHMADDILLKTIVRSNPGIVLFRDGEVIRKWHYKKVPDFETMQNKFMN